MGDCSIIWFLDNENILFDLCKESVNNLLSGGFMVGWGFGFLMLWVYVIYFGGLL